MGDTGILQKAEAKAHRDQREPVTRRDTVSGARGVRKKVQSKERGTGGGEKKGRKKQPDIVKMNVRGS